MTTNTNTNTAFTTRTTKAPALCRHCRKYATQAPAWMGLMESLAPGTGMPEMQMTVSAIARRAAISRPLCAYQIKLAVKDGAMELAPGISGAAVYRRTTYGRQLLGRWKSAGWRA